MLDSNLLNISVTKAWTGENCTIDVNECLKNDSLCDGKANSICNNTIGSYNCLCNIGFKDNGNKCEGKFCQFVILCHSLHAIYSP
jgi:hypothetical protein